MARAGQLWPTATAGNSIGSGSRAGTPRASKDAKAHPGTSLTDAALGLWARPQARDWKDSGPTQGNRKSPNIGTQATRLSCEAGPPDQASSSMSGKRRDSWPTPNAMDSMDAKSEMTPEQFDQREVEKKAANPKLNELQRALAVEAKRGTNSRGSLNPAWVANLMGLPDGWLDGCDVPSSKPLETASSPRSSRKSAAPSSRRKRP